MSAPPDGFPAQEVGVELPALERLDALNLASEPAHEQVYGRRRLQSGRGWP